MAGQDADKNMSVGERQEVFLALVEDQDKGADVVRSRRSIAARFGLTEQQVQRIEREGLDGNWPPLA